MDETVKYIERRQLDRTESFREVDKPKPPRKEGKSPFDEMLEQSRLLQQGNMDTKVQNKQTTQQAIQEIEKRQERSKDSSKDKEKEEDQRQEGSQERKTATGPGRKVVGKTSLKQNQSGSGGGRFDGSGHSAKKGDPSVRIAKKTGLGEFSISQNSSPLESKFNTTLSHIAKAIPKTLPQEVLNQIVRYVRIGLNQNGHQTIELRLHREIFKGLRLRLSSNRGKVSVHFLAATPEVKALFEREKFKIQDKLMLKGIAVEEILVF